MKARVGNLDQRISFYENVDTVDDIGGVNRVLQVLTTVWAYVLPSKGSESGAYEGVQATASTVFIVRLNTSINEKMTIRYLSEDYNIRSIRKSGTRELYMEIEAERGEST